MHSRFPIVVLTLGYFLSVSNNKASGQGGFFGLRP
ncbi:unnamed protein product, partial [Allacma fusca]